MRNDECRTTYQRVLEMRFTRAPRNPCWALRSGGPGVNTALLGWVVDTPSVNAGVPDQAAKLIARTACRSHMLTFLCSDNSLPALGSAWAAVHDGWACTLEPPLVKRILQLRNFPLLATSDPLRAEMLFHCEEFSWELRGQVVLLSPSEAGPPPLTYRDMERLFHSAKINPLEVPLPSEIEGVLLPGVDGDFAELLAFTEALWNDFPATLENECDQQGISWRCVSEEAFQSTAWVIDRGQD